MEDLIAAYFSEMDNALIKLSQHKEGRLTNLLPWNLCSRRILIGKILDYDYYILKAMPDEKLESDSITSVTLATEGEVYQFLDPLFLDIVPIVKDVCRTGRDLSFEIAGAVIHQEDDNKLSKLPVDEFEGVVMCFNRHFVPSMFSSEKAKESALDLRNNTENGLELNISFLRNLERIFNQFNKIILKSFQRVEGS